MTYKKTVIRAYFVAYLKAQILSLSDRIYGGRIDPIHKSKDTFPYLTVFSKSDDVIEEFTSHTERELDLLIGVVLKDNTTVDDFDALVEDLMFKVEEAMSKIIGGPIGTYAENPDDNYRLFEDIVFEKSLITNSNDSGNDIGTAIMSYKISYNYEAPVIPLTLQDFDLDGSIDNITITNPGVPSND